MQHALPIIIICALSVSGLKLVDTDSGTYGNRDSSNTSNNVSAIQAELDIINLETALVTHFDDLNNYLNAITDAHTATLIAPEIHQLNAKLAIEFAHLENLPGEDRALMRIIAKENIGSLEPVVIRILRNPEVAPILEPVVAPLMRNLSAMTQNTLISQLSISVKN